RSSGKSLDISPNGEIVASGIAVKSDLLLDQGTYFPCLIHANTANGQQKGSGIIFNSFANCGQTKVIAVGDGYLMAANDSKDSTTIPNLIKTDFSLNVKWQKK